MSYENPVTPSGDKIISANVPSDGKPVNEMPKTQQIIKNETSEVAQDETKKIEVDYEEKGKDIYYHHKITYYMFCSWVGIVVFFLVAQILMQPFLHTQWAEAFVVRFNEHIQSAEGTGATTGILCNICGIIFILINVIIRIVNRKVFKYARKAHDVIKNKKKGG